MNIKNGRVECPVELLPYAIADPENFALEQLSWPAGASNPFFRDADKIRAVVTDSPNPLNEEAYSLADWFQARPRQGSTDDRPRYMHIDLAISGDAVGIAMCHATGAVETFEMSTDDMRVSKVEMPFIQFDFAGRLRPKAEEGQRMVDYNNIIRIILELQQRQFNLESGLVTLDRFQSYTMMTAIRDLGIPCGLLSIDHTQSRVILDWNKDDKIRKESTSREPSMAYVEFRKMIQEGRVRCPELPMYDEMMNWFEKESLDIMWDPSKRKAYKINDYQASDDLMQAMVGAAFNCQNNIRPTDLPLMDEKDLASEVKFYKDMGINLDPNAIDKDREMDPLYIRPDHQEYIEDDFDLYQKGGVGHGPF